MDKKKKKRSMVSAEDGRSKQKGSAQGKTRNDVPATHANRAASGKIQGGKGRA